MKKSFTILSLAFCVGSINAGTITYSYDADYRLSGVNYNNQATAGYQYDDAHNLTGHTVITDSQYFRPILIYFSQMIRGERQPLVLKQEG